MVPNFRKYILKYFQKCPFLSQKLTFDLVYRTTRNFEKRSDFVLFFLFFSTVTSCKNREQKKEYFQSWLGYRHRFWPFGHSKARGPTVLRNIWNKFKQVKNLNKLNLQKIFVVINNFRFFQTLEFRSNLKKT